MDIERWHPARDTRLAAACHRMYLAGRAVDGPLTPPMPERAFTGWLEHGWTEDHPESWIARGEDGAPCGWHTLAMPERENRHLAEVTVYVSPDRRRRRIGTRLLRHAAARAGASGRTLVASEAAEGTPADAFFRALGARRTAAGVHQVLALPSTQPGRLAELRAEATSAARGYSLLRWDLHVPQQHIRGLLAVLADEGDAPRAPGWEPPRWDAERLRQNMEHVAARGLRYYQVAARCEETGEVAALTQLAVDPENPAWGRQHLTVVARAHRGHRLGLATKLAMLDVLAAAEPQVERIITGNAEDNTHMVAINDALGFQPVSRSLSWEMDVAGICRPPDGPGGGQS